MDGYFLEVNKIACQRLRYTKDELMKLKPYDITYQPENNLKQLKIDIKHHGHVIFEATHVRKDGTFIPVEMNMRMIEYNGIPALLGIARDITERKYAEEIREKDIHHRVKNNLQVISSLLSLQSEFFGNETVIEAFRESQNRVRSMAIAHEKLYQSKDIASIDVADYIQNLTNYLYLSYRGRSSEIGLNVDIDNIFLNMDTAIPLGIIINELVSNSLKHAFVNSETGKIKIKLRKHRNNNYTLIVSDNGKGFPDELDFKETDSLGMQLVNTLVEQIDGTIKLDKYNGTVFTIIFRELVYKN
ncbi:MAG: histidine kinase dimerization/phosphoacceptor domain -containing protein [Methanohalobium sp.]|uniref:PAS domain-containing sensor histidine kinase n=1 Tax=Methanohalobium sp. TaxID=2837493 RepID=UPI00397C28D7